MEKILSIDTSLGNGSASVLNGREVLDEIIGLDGDRGRSDPLASSDNLLRRNQLTFNNIDTIVITRGPGSFTGVRTGLSLLRGWIRAGKRNFYTCSVMEAIASSSKIVSGTIRVVIAAGRKDVAFQDLVRKADSRRLGGLTNIVVADASEFAVSLKSEDQPEVIVESRVLEMLSENEVISNVSVAPRNVATLAALYILESGDREGLRGLEPLYTRDFRPGVS